MKLVCYIVCVSMICIVIALAKKEKKLQRKKHIGTDFEKQ